MLFKEWEILVVDDEPDVLQITKMALRNVEVYGLPLKVRTASSAAEALEIVRQQPPAAPTIAVAFVDVVMETDDAGLKLCEEIREASGNNVTQLYIRTGQPGVAPERAVMDRYDITGYFTKVEMTEEKLYSLVKSGVRQFLWSWSASALATMLSLHIQAADSRAGLSKSREQLIAALLHEEGEPAGLFHQRYAMWMEQDLDIIEGWAESEADSERARVDAQAGVPLSDDGDSFVQDGNSLLVRIGGTDNKIPSQTLFQLPFVPPRSIIDLLYVTQVCFATLWKKAA